MADHCHTTRRAMLKGVPLAVLMGAEGALAGPAETNVVRRYHEWSALRDWIDTTGAAMGADDFDRQLVVLHSVEDDLLNLPSAGPLDTLAKLMVITLNGADIAEWEGAEEVSAEAVGWLLKEGRRRP